MSSIEEPSEEPSDVSTEELKRYAVDIGINPETEQEFMWLAKQAMFAQLPPGWSECEDDSGNTTYHNHYLQYSTDEHPSKLHYRKMVAQQRERFQRMSGAILGSEGTQGKKENDALNTVGLFSSGFLSIIGSKHEETASLTPLSFDDDDDGIISEKESIPCSSNSDIEHVPVNLWSKQYKPSGEFQVSDSSICCDSLVETDDKDKETKATQGQTQAIQEHKNIQRPAAICCSQAQQDQKKQEPIKAPIDSGSSDVCITEDSSEPAIRDPSTESSEEQLTVEALDSSVDFDTRLEVYKGEQGEDEETEVAKSLDESVHSPGEKRPDRGSGAEKGKQAPFSSGFLSVIDTWQEEAVCYSPGSSGDGEGIIFDIDSGSDLAEEFGKSQTSHSLKSSEQQMPAEFVYSDNSDCGDSQDEKDAKVNEAVRSVHRCSVRQECTDAVADSGTERHNDKQEPINQTIKRTSDAYPAKEMMKPQMCDKTLFKDENYELPQQQDTSESDTSPSDETTGIETSDTTTTQTTSSSETSPTEKTTESPSDDRSPELSQQQVSQLDTDSCGCGRQQKMDGEEEETAKRFAVVHMLTANNDHVCGSRSIEPTPERMHFQVVISQYVADAADEHDDDEEVTRVPSDFVYDDSFGCYDSRQKMVVDGGGEEEEEETDKSMDSSGSVSFDSQLKRGFKGQREDEDSEGTQSQYEPGHNSFGEDIQIHQEWKLDKPAKISGKKIHSLARNTESPKQKLSVFLECRTYVCPGSQHVVPLQEEVDDENVAAKSQDEEDKEEPSQVPALLVEFLDSSNSASEEREDNYTEAYKSSQDDPSCDEVYNHRVVHQHEHIQCTDVVEYSEANQGKENDQSTQTPVLDSDDSVSSSQLEVDVNKEGVVEEASTSKSLDETGTDFFGEDVDSVREDHWYEHIQCPASGVSQVEPYKVKKNTVKTPGSQPPYTSSAAIVAIDGELHQQSCHPHLFVKVQTELSLGQGRMHFHQEELRGLEEDGEEHLKIKSEARMLVCQEAKCKHEEEEEEHLKGGVQLRLRVQQEELQTQEDKEEEHLKRQQKEARMHLRQEELWNEEDEQLVREKEKGEDEEEKLRREEEEKADHLKSGKEMIICIPQEQMSSEGDEKLKSDVEIRIQIHQEVLKKDGEEHLMKEKQMRRQLSEEKPRRGEEEAEHLMREKQMRRQLSEEKPRRGEEEAEHPMKEKQTRRQLSEEKPSREKKEEAGEKLKREMETTYLWQEELSTEEKNEVEQLKREKEVRATVFQVGLMREEHEETEQFMREKGIRIHHCEEQLSTEEEEEVDQLKMEKGRRICLCLEDLRREEEEEVERLKMDIYMRKCLLQDELSADFKKEMQMRVQFCQDELRKEEEEEVEKLRKEKEIRIYKQKEKLMTEEDEEVAQLKKEKERRICDCLKELRRQEEEEVEQLIQKKDTRMRRHMQQLNKDEETVNHVQKEPIKEKEQESSNNMDMRKNLQADLSSVTVEAERAKRQKDLTCRRQQEDPKREEEKDEQSRKEKDARIRLGQEDEMRKDWRNAHFLQDKQITDEKELKQLKKEKEKRMRLYQEKLRKEEEDEIESLKREHVAKVCLHKEALNREEEKEMEQLERQKEARMRARQQEVRREEEIEMGRLKRGKQTKATHHGVNLRNEEEEAERLRREEMMALLYLEELKRAEEEDLESLKMDIMRRWLRQGEVKKEQQEDVLKTERETRAPPHHGLSRGGKNERLKREEEERMYICQEELSTEEEEELEQIKREKQKSSRKDKVEEAERKMLRKEGEEVTERLKKKGQKHVPQEELEEERDEAKQFNWEKEKGRRGQPAELGREDENFEMRKREKVLKRRVSQENLRSAEEEAVGGLIGEKEKLIQLSQQEKKEDVTVLTMEKQRIHLCQEELKREEDEVKQLERQKENRIRQHQEDLRIEEENEADELRREKEARIRGLREELKAEEEEETERLKRDKEKRMRLLQEELRREEEEDRLKWENDRRIWHHQEELTRQEEEKWSRIDRQKRMRLHLEKLRIEEEETAERLKREKERRMQLHREELRREEAAEVEQLRREKEKRISFLQGELKREEEEQQYRREKEKRMLYCQERLHKEEDDTVNLFKRAREKKMHYCQTELKQEEGEEAERLNGEKHRIRLLQDELRREADKLIERLMYEKEHRTRLRHMDLSGEEEERKLKTEYKEKLRALRLCLLAKRKEEEALLNKLSDQKEGLSESVQKEPDEEQFKLRSDTQLHKDTALQKISMRLCPHQNKCFLLSSTHKLQSFIKTELLEKEFRNFGFNVDDGSIVFLNFHAK
ncbi:trichohyalin-like isoform X3 [Dunckerocampus dactyliophorus]|uniref:trichohyalin-like isoform X3 n=1 Tax=Dunckerocampus dactyliophorus TaxID=161453 RepID=UPI002405DFA4|nr:trichohyalin-like isoform X3 [Dunckerocampus dactyliophorus]